jgi:hypothetical protein
VLGAGRKNIAASSLGRVVFEKLVGPGAYFNQPIGVAVPPGSAGGIAYIGDYVSAKIRRFFSRCA